MALVNSGISGAHDFQKPKDNSDQIASKKWISNDVFTLRLNAEQIKLLSK